MPVDCDKREVRKAVESSLASHADEAGKILGVLVDVQERFRYIPYEALLYLSELTGVSLARLYGICTFFSNLSLEPVGKYLVMVCDGTACHTRGSLDILQALENVLKIKVGQTTPDGKFTLRLVGCVGACGQAPIVVVNSQTFGRIRLAEAPQILNLMK